MKFELIDSAYNIANFDSQATELTYVLNKVTKPKKHIKKHITGDIDVAIILNGFELTLELIKQYPELIQPTLYGTMKLANRKYQYLTRFERMYTEVSAVSLATNYLGTAIRYYKVINK